MDDAVLVVRSTTVSVSPKSFATTTQRASRNAMPNGFLSVPHERDTTGADGVDTSTSRSLRSPCSVT